MLKNKDSIILQILSGFGITALLWLIVLLLSGYFTPELSNNIRNATAPLRFLLPFLLVGFCLLCGRQAGSRKHIHFYRTVCAVLLIPPLSYVLGALLLTAFYAPYGQGWMLTLSDILTWFSLPFALGANVFGESIRRWVNGDWLVYTLISMVLYAVFIAAGCIGGYALYRRTKKQALEKSCEA